METKSAAFSENKPLFSIIMPCYNSEDYVDKAIQSCINQTFDNWELIIVNDGSTDNTLNIINSYASQDNRISVHSKNNGGYVSAVNFGLDYASGNYFMFLGSDDELSYELFSDIYKHIKHIEKPDLIGFKTLIKKNDQTRIPDKYTDFDTIADDYNSNIKDFSTKYPKHSSIFFSRDTSKLYKTSVLGSLRYFGEKGMDADGIFSMLFSHKASSFLCVPTVGYIWYLRSDSLSGRKQNFPTQKDRIENWIKFGNEVLKMNSVSITHQEKYYLSNYFYSIVKATFLSYYSECFKYDILKISATFIKNTAEFLNINITKEIKLFIKHMFLWKLFIFIKLIYKKIKKRLKHLSPATKK